jgi:hypothetical protein
MCDRCPVNPHQLGLHAGSSPAFGTSFYIYYQRVMLMHNPFFVGHWLVRQPTGEISWYGRAFSNGKSLQWQIATTAYAKILFRFIFICPP